MRGRLREKLPGKLVVKKAQRLLPGFKVSFAIFQLWDLEQGNFCYALNVCVQSDGVRRRGLGSWLGQRGRTVMNGTSVSTKETPERPLTLPSREDTARRHQLWVRKRALPRTPPYWCLEFGLPGSRTVVNRALMFSSSPAVVFCCSCPNRLRQPLCARVCPRI